MIFSINSVIILFLELINNNISERMQSIIKGFLFVILSLIVGLRGIEIGNDTREYYNLFHKYGNLNGINQAFNYIEFGYVIFNYLLYRVSSDPIILTLASSFFFYYVFFYVFMKDNKSFLFGLIMFTNSIAFFFTFSGLRQTMALALLMVAYRYIAKSGLKYYAIVFIAATFHISSIIFIILPLLQKIAFNYKIMFYYFLLGIIIFVFFGYFINFALRIFPKYSVYLDSAFFTEGKIGSISGFLLFFFLYFMVVLISHRKFNGIFVGNNEEVNLLLHLITISTILSFISIKFALINRINIYFMVFFPLILPEALSYRKSSDKRLIKYIIIIVVCLYSTTILLKRPGWYSITPYKMNSALVG